MTEEISATTAGSLDTSLRSLLASFQILTSPEFITWRVMYLPNSRRALPLILLSGSMAFNASRIRLLASSLRSPTNVLSIREFISLRVLNPPDSKSNTGGASDSPVKIALPT